MRSKKKWVCAQCSAEHITWEGICRQCSGYATLKEVNPTPDKVESKESATARKLRRRAKDSERLIAKRMSAADGPDPAFEKIASSTGRIGHITGIRVDAVSLSYVTENKNRKIPTWMVKAWVLINQRAIDFNKNALLHIEPPNMPRSVKINGSSVKLDTMAVITQTRHEELIKTEKLFKTLLEIVEDVPELAGKLQDFYRTYLEHNSPKIP